MPSECRVELKATKDGYHLYQSVGFIEEVSKYHSMKWYNNIANVYPISK